MKTAKLKYILSLCIYGTIGMILKRTTLPSELIVFARGSIGATFIYLYVRLRGGRLSKENIRVNLKWLVIGGILLGLNWVLLFAAYRFTTVAIAILCNYTAPLILIFLSPVLYGEKLGFKKLLCVAAAAVGICLVSGAFGGRQIAAEDIKGILLALLSALCFAGIIICNKNTNEASPYDKVIIQLAISAAVVLPYVLLVNHGNPIHADVRSCFWMLVLALVHTGFAYCLYFSSVEQLPVQTVAIFGYIEPVVAVLCSAVILAEPLGLSGAVGAVLVIGAAIMSEKI